MDTKSKKLTSLKVGLIMAVILLPALLIVSLYPKMEEVYVKQLKEIESQSEDIKDEHYQFVHNTINYLMETSYVTYSQILSEKYEQDVDFSVLGQYGWIDDAITVKDESLYYLEYKPGKNDSVIEKNTNISLHKLFEEDLSFTLKKGILDALKQQGCVGYFILEFNAQGMLSDVRCEMFDDVSYEGAGAAYSIASESVNQYRNNVRCYNEENGTWLEASDMEPTNMRCVYAIERESMFVYAPYGAYRYRTDPIDIYFQMGSEWLILGLASIVALFALVLPFVKPLKTGKEKLFSLPLEINVGLVIVGAFAAVSMFFVMCYSSLEYISKALPEYGSVKFIDYTLTPETIHTVVWVFSFFGWAFCFFLEYIVVSAGRQFIAHPLIYIKENSICGKIVGSVWNWLKKIWKNITKIDLDGKLKIGILKIVLVNCLVLIVCSLFGPIGMMVYSIVLLLVLWKQTEVGQKQYRDILHVTTQMAEGNLKAELPDELGMFSSLGVATKKVQEGFAEAVFEEAKSQNMKTELITNVSHDLKTPLTAMITYISLLKEDRCTEEERVEYIDTIDKKATRLKILIEDLFEVSKATTNNLTMNFEEVDLVSLLKGVCLENEDRITVSTLDIRWSLPEEKCMVLADPNRMYRVMDNLLQNALKYSMPNSRVYIQMEEKEDEYEICFKNVSAAEMNFDAKEITERFVRGDLARNTEGSGLGLAIARSFTELQGGRFEIEIDGDLFKAKVYISKLKCENILAKQEENE